MVAESGEKTAVKAVFVNHAVNHRGDDIGIAERQIFRVIANIDSIKLRHGVWPVSA